MAEGLSFLEGEKPFKTATFERAAAITRISEDWLVANRHRYNAALCDHARTHKDGYLLIMALERDGMRCRRCQSSAVRLPVSLTGRRDSADDYVSMCAACRDRYNALDEKGKAKARAWFAKPNAERPPR